MSSIKILHRAGKNVRGGQLSKHLSTLSDISNSIQSCSRAMSCISRSSPAPIWSHSSSVSGSTSAIVMASPATSHNGDLYWRSVINSWKSSVLKQHEKERKWWGYNCITMSYCQQATYHGIYLCLCVVITLTDVIFLQFISNVCLGLWLTPWFVSLR